MFRYSLYVMDPFGVRLFVERLASILESVSWLRSEVGFPPMHFDFLKSEVLIFIKSTFGTFVCVCRLVSLWVFILFDKKYLKRW